MANMPGSPPGSPDYAAMMEQVSIVPEFRLVSCQQCIWSDLVTPLVCQMLANTGVDGEWDSQDLQPAGEVEAAPEPSLVASEVP